MIEPGTGDGPDAALLLDKLNENPSSAGSRNASGYGMHGLEASRSKLGNVSTLMFWLTSLVF